MCTRRLALVRYWGRVVLASVQHSQALLAPSAFGCAADCADTNEAELHEGHLSDLRARTQVEADRDGE
jgi:hypothetical protein